MTFLGVPSYENVIIEGHNAEPERTEEIKAASIAEAQKWVKLLIIILKALRSHLRNAFSYSVLFTSHLSNAEYLEILLCNSIILP